MPAHIPVILGLGLSVGVATALFINRDKIKDFIEEKKRELELELHEWNEEYQRAFNPDMDIALTEQRARMPDPEMRDQSVSAKSSLTDPFSDSNEILSIDSNAERQSQQLRNRAAINNSFMGESDDDLYHSVPSAQFRHTGAVDNSSDEDDDLYHSVPRDSSRQGSELSGFFSFVDVKDDEFESGTSTTGEVFTPTASEAGDYILARELQAKEFA